MRPVQAVLLAGGVDARRLQPFTDAFPKCLLPVANRTLLSFQLEFMANAGLKEVFVVTNEMFEDVVGSFLETFRQEASDKVSSLVLHLVVVGDYIDTAAALLILRDRITTDNFLVVSGDLIVDDKFFVKMYDRHHSRGAAVTALIYEEKKEDEKASSKHDPTKIIHYIGLDESSERFTYLSSSADIGEDETIRLDNSLLDKFPSFTMHTYLKDAHLYLFARWTLELLEARKSMLQSISHHFVPYLLTLQRRNKLPNVTASQPPDFPSGFVVPSAFSPEVSEMSSTYEAPNDTLKCFAWVLDSSAFCGRVLDLSSYLELNRAIASGKTSYVPLEPLGQGKQKGFIGPTADISQQTQVPTGCIVGDNTKIGIRVGVKKSIIGKHCTIGNGAKILNSVIFDHVTIQENAKIQNSVIGSNCYIEAECEVTECFLGAGCSLDRSETVIRRRLRDTKE